MTVIAQIQHDSAFLSIHFDADTEKSKEKKRFSAANLHQFSWITVEKNLFAEEKELEKNIKLYSRHGL